MAAGTPENVNRTALKANLATRLNGVAPSDIVLAITAASVRVHVTITPRNGVPIEDTRATLVAMASSTATLSIALGLQILSVTSVSVSPSSPETLAGAQSSTVACGISCAAGQSQDQSQDRLQASNPSSLPPSIIALIAVMTVLIAVVLLNVVMCARRAFLRPLAVVGVVAVSPGGSPARQRTRSSLPQIDMGKIYL